MNPIDPRVLLRVKDLELRARMVVEGFLSGLHRSPYHGFSVEFSEYRAYTPGDDLRYLDWRLLARTDRRYVKRFEDETNLRCHLIVDLSRSMGFSHERPPKIDYAVTLAATLATFLAHQRDATGLMTFGSEVIDYLPPRFRPGHLQRLLLALDRAVSGTGTYLVHALEKLASIVERRGLIVLVSDLLAPLDGIETALSQLRARGQEVLVFRVLDPAEVTFPFTESTLFEDAETGRRLYVDPQAARATYRRQFDAHTQALRTQANAQGIDLVELTTEEPLELALFAYLQARARRGRSIMRRDVGGPA